MAQQDVLIAGAGPTGMVLALWLTRQNVPVRIISKTTGPGTTSRALAVHARTLELYRQLDLAEAAIAGGHKNPAANLWSRGKRRMHLPLSDAGKELTPYPFALIFPQDLHERLLVEKLQSLGVTIEWETELVDFEDHGDTVTAWIRNRGGSVEKCKVRYLAGCDGGAHSVVRHKIGTAFQGGMYHHTFYVADVEATGRAVNGEIHIAFEGTDFVAVFGYDGERCRLVGAISDENVAGGDALTFEDVSHKAIDSLKLQIKGVNWFSTYRVHHRVADQFRKGHAFLLGDAAHVHSPVGGQGMNTGIGDAINFAWKLAAVLKGERDSLLDSYPAERQKFAYQLVETTDRAFKFVTADGSLANFIRTRVAPLIVTGAYQFGFAREFAFRVVSQTQLNYHDCPLSEGEAGKVRGGDRLPWAVVNGVDNYEPLRQITWQVHVYGDADADLEDWCRQNQFPLHAYEWNAAYAKVGFERNAVYLLRPDTYVALAEPGGNAESLHRYFASRGMATTATVRPASDPA